VTGVDGDEGAVGVAGVDLLPQADVKTATRQRNSVERSITELSFKKRPEPEREERSILPRVCTISVK